MISIENVSKSFDGRHYALRDVSLEVQRGETLVLLGSSGSGKTTLLKLTNRLLEPTSGTIRIDGDDLSTLDPIALRRRIGYVFQGIGLFPHMTVEANVSIVPRLLGWSRLDRRSRARQLLEIVGLDPDTHSPRYPDELSGGQQQRVGVARALAADPDVLLMDEPFGALDALTRDNLQQELVSLRERLRKTIVFVTHDIFEALGLGHRIAVLHEGRLEQVGTKNEIVGSPETEFVRELFEKPARQLSAYREMI